MDTETHNYFATSPNGIGPLLAHELRILGAQQVRAAQAGVSFSGPLVLGYKTCLWSRLASRVLLLLNKFHISNEQDLYDGIRQLDWSTHFSLQQTFLVHCFISHSSLTHSHYAALKVKDAIVDQFREAYGERPSIALEQPDIRIAVHIHKNLVTVYLDLAGESLHRRGYRGHTSPAPLKENLAAALLIASDWHEFSRSGMSFCDPMCGSGTLLIEAALIAGQIAPGYLRNYYGFLGWKQHQPQVWKTLFNEAQHNFRTSLANFPLQIMGFDTDMHALKTAKENIAQAQLSAIIQVEKSALHEAKPLIQRSKNGLVMMNPPYGERLGDKSELPKLYQQIGISLKETFQGWNAAVFTGNPDLLHRLRLQSTKSSDFLNGSIKCKLNLYKISNTTTQSDICEGDQHLVISPPSVSKINPVVGPIKKHTSVTLLKSQQIEMFCNRFNKNRKALSRWVKRDNISCYRIYDADIPEFAVAIDLYQGENLWVHVQEYSAPVTVDPLLSELRLKGILAALPELLDIPAQQIFVKIRQRQKGLDQYEKQAHLQDFYTVCENGYQFLVNFSDYLDTGLFLDHRLTRQQVGKLAENQHFLNLFGYTGTATIYAAKGGAITTTTIDLSNTYLTWAEKNLALNEIRGNQHQLIQEDCLSWLTTQTKLKHRNRYGLIFLDPPTFSNSKRMTGTLDIQRDHVELISLAMRLLESNGTLIFSTNRRKFKLDMDNLNQFRLNEITSRTIPPDFQRNAKIHQCWQIFHAES